MQQSRKLGLIQSESNPQKRLSLLVAHGFKDEASTMIRELVHNHTAMFHNDWHDKSFCRPLERVTKDQSAVYVICCSRGFDYHPYPHLHKDGEWHIVFELGWERKVLGWSEKESQELVRQICAQALVRPLNQWEFKQAEGTGRAARQVLTADDPIAREIAALHLVYHLRQADFGNIGIYLSKIGQSSDVQGNWVKGFDTQATVNWITRRLIHLGWAHDRIRKEYVEWLWLKTGTWPQWLLAVAKAEGVFLEYDPVREIALRRWIRQGFDRILATADREDKSRISEETEVYRELFKLARLTFYDVNWWITEKLVAMMANGKGWNVKWFEAEFGQSIGLCPLNLDRIRTQAIEIAKKAGRYGVAAGLIRDGGQQPDKELVDQAAILG